MYTRCSIRAAISVVALTTAVLYPGLAQGQVVAGPSAGSTTGAPVDHAVPAYGMSAVPIVPLAGIGYYSAGQANKDAALPQQSYLFLTWISLPGMSVGFAYGLPANTSEPAPSVRKSFYAESPRAAPSVAAPAPAEAGTALINLEVPASADVRFDGVKTTQTGEQRHFVTPALAPGRDYSYAISASWVDNGKEVHKSRRFHVRAGERLDIDFTSAGTSLKTATVP